MTSETITCRDCEKTFTWTRETNYSEKPYECPECVEAEIEAEYAKACGELPKALAKLTPARYLATDESHPDFNLKLWQKIKGWTPTPEQPWLGMVGPTGRSKTRCGFKIFGKVAAQIIRRGETGRTRARPPAVAVASGTRVAEAVMAQFANDTQSEALAFLNRLRFCDLLFLDDLGKQRNTPAVASELWALLDHRHENNLATIWTANVQPEAIVAGMDEHMASPLAGRLRECSTIFTLNSTP